MDGYKAHNLQCSVWSCQWRFDISLEILENLETLPIKTCTSILELAKCIYLVHAPSTSTPYHLHTHHGHFSERSREINSAKRTAICWHALRGFCHTFVTCWHTFVTCWHTFVTCWHTFVTFLLGGYAPSFLFRLHVDKSVLYNAPPRALSRQ